MPAAPTRSLAIPMLLVVLTSLVVTAVPFWVIRPFTAQDARQLQVALWLVRWGPVLTSCCGAAALVLMVLVWRKPGARRGLRRASSVVAAGFVLATALVSRVNVYEKMFHSIASPGFVPAKDAAIEPRDMVLAVRSGTVSRAYPVRALTFHHIVNDAIGGEAIAVTYCSLCHTGIVWSRVVDGRVLTLHIGGINNQNMLMRDDETGTFWQQSTGEALSGPLAGKHLRMVSFDELAFESWRAEAPLGFVLAPVAGDAHDYASADWEARMGKRAAVKPTDGPLAPRDLVLGMTSGGEERAFPLALVLESPVSLDTVGGVPVALLVAPDGQSVRAFDARLDGRPLELFGRASAPGEWLDLELRSWTFDGCTSEPGTRRCLAPIPIFRSYWFDWLEHHPRTTVATPLGLKRRVR